MTAAIRRAMVTGIMVLALLITGLSEGLALHVTTSPDPFKTLIRDTLNITCRTDGLVNSVKEIIFIEIGKLGESPIAVVRKQELVMGSTSKDNMKAEGQIVSNASQCFLTVTINKPSFDEAGVYVCKSYSLDQQYQIKDTVVPINVTIDEVDTTAVLTHLWLKVKVQDDQIKVQNDQLQEQRRELEIMKVQEKKNVAFIDDLLDTVLRLNETIRDQKKLIDFDINKVNESLSKMKVEDSYQCAFSNRFNWDKDAFKEGETVRFSDTITNIGNAYNAETGLFTAPCDGVYVFFVVVLTRNSDDVVNMNLQVNGNTVAKLVAGDKEDREQASMNTVVSIKAGDIVRPYMSIFGGSNTIYAIHSYFSGFLLHAV